MDIPYIITCCSLTNLTVSSPMRRRTSRCVAICWSPQLAVQKRLGAFVTTLTCSSCSSTGHGGRLSRRASRWRSVTARCLTYAQQWTSWGTSVASCPACTPCQAVTPSLIPLRQRQEVSCTINATNPNVVYTQGLIFTAHTNTSTLFAPNSQSVCVTTNLPVHLITPGNMPTSLCSETTNQ